MRPSHIERVSMNVPADRLPVPTQRLVRSKANRARLGRDTARHSAARRGDPRPAGQLQDRSYEYDGFERLTRALEGTATHGVRYEYDALDRRDARIDERDNNQCFEYAYLGATEALSREQANNNETRFYDYDSRLRRLGQVRKSGTSPLAYRAYSVDSNGTVLGLEVLGGFGDDAGRIGLVVGDQQDLVGAPERGARGR
jgi:hypothetical protein